MRDSHAAHGFFVPQPEEEDQAVIEAAQWAAEGVSAETLAILDEIEILRNKRSGLGAGVILLLVSVGLFFALGAAVWPWGFVAMLLPILFFHELGHYAAMRIFRYSNVKMFFIPLLGAAVSGRHYNVPGWKKVIVSLAGPLPGIFLGTGLGIAAAYFDIGWLHHTALLTIGLNGFNLLPILPLDGGWVVHALLFSRHHILDAGFRLIAVAAILAGAYFSGSRFLFFFGLVMAAGLPIAVRMAGVISTIRKLGISTASPDDQSIPPRTAEAIVTEIRERLPQSLSNKQIAQFTLQAFEALNARPPGILATILLGGTYLGSFLFALVALGLLTMGMPMFARPDLSPRHPIEVGQIEVAVQIQDALQAYDFCPLSIIPDAPWHPVHPPTSEEQEARMVYGALIEAEWMGDDPEFDRLHKESIEARKNGDTDRCTELDEEMETLRKSIRQRRIDKIFDETNDPRQRELIELYQRYPVYEEPDLPDEPGESEPEVVRMARHKARAEYDEQVSIREAELAKTLGGVRSQNLPLPGADRFGLNLGEIERDGSTIHIHGAQLTRPVNGAPAIVRWLDSLGCTEMKYLFLGRH